MKEMSTKVKVYKVCLPSYYAWPPGKVILKVCYTEANAEIYVASYPNVFLKPWLTIESEEITVESTD